MSKSPPMQDDKSPEQTPETSSDIPVTDTTSHPADNPVRRGEIGGPKGLEPTRYGDWERNGRCTDF